MLYRLAQASKDAFHDITDGDIFVPCAQGTQDCSDSVLGFPAAPGYDMATGLGSVDVTRLLAAWGNGSASTTTVSADSSKLGISDSVKVTVTVKGSGSTAPTGTVAFLTSLDAALGSAQLSGSGSNGTASISLAAQDVLAGDGKVYALYSGDGLYGSSTGSIALTANTPATGSMVVVSITPNPTNVVAVNDGAAPFNIVLSEKAGVATRLTQVVLSGRALSARDFASIFADGAIPAGGTLTTPDLGVAPSAVPADIDFRFSGQDADGTPWTRTATLHVNASPAPGTVPGITLTSLPSNVVQNPQADPSCQWSFQLTLHETGGYYTTLPAAVQPIFGTTRLAPFGSLTGPVCLGPNLPTTRTYQISGQSDLGIIVSDQTTVTFGPAPITPATLSVSTKTVRLSVADNGQSDTTSFEVSFTGGSPQWTVTASPVTPSWLTFTPSSNTGNGTVKVSVNATGLSKGVYNTTLTILSTGSLPQAFYLPVTFTVGASTTTSISAVANGASFKPSYAPGMILSVFGANLAPKEQVASTLPLPLSMQGVSATVNGISAPLYYVGPGQLNIQIPYETGLGTAVLAVNNNGKVTSFLFQVSVTAPGIFVAGDGTNALVPNTSGKAGDTLLAFITGDGDQTPTLATGATTPAGTPISQLPKSRQTVSLTVGGVPAIVVFSGIPSGLAGVTQINFVVPTVPAGVQDVVVTVGGVASAPAKLTIR
jgi:uncharacterized protein (TIGR03437 family)